MSRLKELDSFKGHMCAFCGQNVYDELLFGKIYQYGNIITHYFCMLFSSGMEQKGEDEDGIFGFLPADIKKELSRASKLKCSICNDLGASINCSQKKCKSIFHFPCGVENGSLHKFFGEFKSFCPFHREIQNVPRDACNRTGVAVCVICHDEVKPRVTLQTIWAPCCGKAWFHRVCVQKMALSAGYLFKCPNCNNKENFRQQMLNCGIYIPDQDASWEFEPNFFRELNERYSHCDAHNCLCPNGRDYSPADDENWELRLCKYCGSQGIHDKCAVDDLDDEGNWACPFCSSAVSSKSRIRDNPAGPSKMCMTRGNLAGPSENNRRDRSRMKRKKKRPSTSTPDSESSKKQICARRTSREENSSCLINSSGESIQVVRLDTNQPLDDNVVEIGGVKVQGEIIEIDSDDEDGHSSIDDKEGMRMKIDKSKPKSDIIIDLIEDSDDDVEPTSSSVRHNDSDSQDDEVIFVGQEAFGNNVSAMVQIAQNVFSIAEIKRTTTSTISISENMCTNPFWRSVPLHKSIVHSLKKDIVSSRNDLASDIQMDHHSSNKVTETIEPVTSSISSRYPWSRNIDSIELD